MINKILIGIFKIITKLITVILAPINLIISSMLPNFDLMLGAVGRFFNQVGTYSGFIFNSLFLNPDVVSFVILYWIFKLTFPLAVSTIKLVVKWYNSLKV